jgi:tetratricopeptide (TPR) repeat protein
MRKALLLVYFIIVCSTDKILATPYIYDYNSGCSRAYQLYMGLHLTDANNAIRQEIMQNPYNLMLTYLSDYDDFLSLFINGDKKELDQRRGHMDQRLDILAEGDENSPWYKLCRAGIYLHWALINVRFGENFKAAIQFRKSFLLLKDNKKKFPDFDYNNFFYGLEEAAVGTTPEGYKWLTSLFGMKGNVKDGIALMGNFVEKHTASDLLQPEAMFFYNFMKFYLLYKQDEVWSYLNSPQFPASSSLLCAFIKGNMARNYRKADIAIQAYRECSSIKDYSHFPLFEYELGCSLFLKLDPSCIDHFKSFIEHYKGNLFIKDAWYKMALIYYLQQNTAQADYCRQQIMVQGNTLVDVDKTAMRFSKNDKWPNVNLLKAHMFIDGGYYQQALDLLSTMSEQGFNDLSDKLEYNFRLGRAYDEAGQKNKALNYYQRTINLGRYETDYFAARSALQMGFIYEKSGNTNEALKRYNECLEMKDHDFKNAIDQQAKAGINRLTIK